MTKNALYIQSGGPTTVINASAFGVIQECRRHADEIGTLYGVRHGVIGLLNDGLVDIFALDQEQIPLLPQTPSMAFGSCRYRIPDAQTDDTDYKKVLEALRVHDIGYLFYNGGNGTLCACHNMYRYLQSQGYDCKVMVIPKTVDNDIEHIDHAPGYPSTARHVAITIAELAHDTRSYNTDLITIVEVMGRNTGWIAAATLAACKEGNGPDLIYVPEVDFSPEKFIADVHEVYVRKGKCMAVVAEGVRDTDGKYLFEYGTEDLKNPDQNMGGTTPYLTTLLRGHFDCKIRGIDLGLMQRCAMHDASPLDIREAIRLGERAVEQALLGISDKMVSLERISGDPYRMRETLVDITDAAEGGHAMPLTYIMAGGNFIRPEFLAYIEPLIGELPRYAKLNVVK
ncbi:MAG: 6-phosphofructokinase [Eubacteriales bacterium]|nr:6-phosphofructokinase [Eubacteriales bacterium]